MKPVIKNGTGMPVIELEQTPSALTPPPKSPVFETKLVKNITKLMGKL